MSNKTESEFTYTVDLPAGKFMVMATINNESTMLSYTIQVAKLSETRSIALNLESSDHAFWWSEDGYSIGMDEVEAARYTDNERVTMRALATAASSQVRVLVDAGAI